ncbi:hypothetical protein SEA_SPOOKY_57 [Gordonia phage Spooky]|nr:hypothetical protein SEA_SPOOKY_57 [Gordonia phage Spooky]
MSGLFHARYEGWCRRCKEVWEQDQLIGYVRECLLYPPESRKSMTSTELGRTVTVCASCAGEVSR